MKYIHTFTILFSLSLFIGCQSNQQENQITDPQDYNVYLSSTDTKSYDYLVSDLNFWTQKLHKTPNQYPYLGKLAQVESTLFSITADIDNLLKAEKHLVALNAKTAFKNAGTLRALARNYISQHRFKEALVALQKAEIVGENLLGTQKMLFDVFLELGDYQNAEHYLTIIQNFSDFDYLIRASKWNDHLGDLDTAIRLLEKATTIAVSAKNTNLMIWSFTNLADFYGHNNQIQKSYTYYLKALELDPANAYAKKGIAWIVYSHEKNSEEALRIIDHVIEYHPSPDYFLLKAEIEDYRGNITNKIKNINTYLSLVKNKKYGDMYNHYNAQLYLDDLNKNIEAFQLIETELQNRSTPLSYDLLAWAYYKERSYEKALQISENFVKGHTYEPQAMYHLAEIYKANKKFKEVKELKNELLESAYELGPLLTSKIKML